MTLMAMGSFKDFLFKSSNILMADERKTLKIGDFGVAKQGNDTQDLFKTALGSLGYESPDFKLNKTYTIKIDVW